MLSSAALVAHRSALAGLMVGAAVSMAAAQNVPPPPALEIAVSPAQERWRQPVTEAADEAASIARDWLGAHPSGTVAITIHPPLWQGQGAMVVERQAATDVIRSWWPAALADPDAAAMIDGFAWYLQSHAIERLFDRRYRRTAYSTEWSAYFGDHIIWSFPTLRLPRWSAPIGREAAVFGTLERWLGEPVLQGAMFAAARLPAERLTATSLKQTISAAAGQDLTWWLDAVSDPAITFDYAVTALATAPAVEPCPAPCFDTSVTVARRGPGRFSGRTAPPVGAFESGDAVRLRVTFAGGEQAWARWDGRDDSRTFRFQGPAPATSAHLDPERVLLLDTNPLNNLIATPSPTNVPVAKWMARWMVWLQNAVLTYGFFA